jgi:hypothetical protein
MIMWWCSHDAYGMVKYVWGDVMHNFYSTSLLSTWFMQSDFSELSKNVWYRRITSEGLIQSDKWSRFCMRGIKVGFWDGTQHNPIEWAILWGSAKISHSNFWGKGLSHKGDLIGHWSRVIKRFEDRDCKHAQTHGCWRETENCASM